MATLSDFLALGYFPREIPPTFTTLQFAQFATSQWSHLPEGPLRRWTQCVSHNLARPGGLRRPLKIPNPFSHAGLCSHLVANWAAIEAHTQQTDLAASRPHHLTASGRAIVPRVRYHELPRMRAAFRRSARYLLHTDINNFYPSIYTHSIPWALHGKMVAKAQMCSPTLLGNVLDGALRSQQWGQTVGIPIGPDASLVAAEILLSAADIAVVARVGGSLPVRGFRYVDDYELAFRGLAEAEGALSDLEGILATFELALNPRKTRIAELPEAIEDAWAIELGRLEVRHTPVAQRNDVVALFSRAFEIAHGTEGAVLKYALQKVRGVPLLGTTWTALQNLALGAITADPSCAATALGLLAEASACLGAQVSIPALGEVLEALILRHGPLGHGSECSWALWGAIAFGVQLSANVARVVSAMDDDLVVLLALHAETRGVFAAPGLDKTYWLQLVAQPGVLEGDHWLLAYEANQQGWIPLAGIAADPLFGSLSAAGVSFYDRGLATPHFPAAGGAVPGGALTDYFG